MTVRYFYALTEQGFVYAGRTFGYDFDDAAEGDARRAFLSTAGTPRRVALSAVRSTGIRRTRSLRA